MKKIKENSVEILRTFRIKSRSDLIRKVKQFCNELDMKDCLEVVYNLHDLNPYKKRVIGESGHYCEVSLSDYEALKRTNQENLTLKDILMLSDTFSCHSWDHELGWKDVIDISCIEDTCRIYYFRQDAR